MKLNLKDKRTMMLKVYIHLLIIALTKIFNAEWEKKMSDYDSDYVYLIPLKYKSTEVYFENIVNVPSRLRGAFIIDEETENKIDFEIQDPKGNRVYFISSHQCIFDFKVKTPGKYSIIFLNKYVTNELRVTFTMNTGQSVILKKDDLTKTEENLDSLMSKIKRFNTEFKMNRNIHQERYKSKI